MNDSWCVTFYYWYQKLYSIADTNHLLLRVSVSEFLRFLCTAILNWSGLCGLCSTNPEVHLLLSKSDSVSYILCLHCLLME